MDHLLNDTEVRVLGSLIEKEITTPDNYPLSLDALTNACNQSSSRSPVVRFDEETVTRAVDSLREKRLVHVMDRGHPRLPKYYHVTAEVMNLEAPQIAAMCVLMLRGPQTVGEVRTRTTRLHDFRSLDEVEGVLNSLIARAPVPLVMRLPRQRGHKEVRYAHLLSGVVTTDDQVGDDRIGKLEQANEQLRKEVESLKKQLEQFRKQLES